MNMTTGRRYQVFAIKATNKGTIWTKAGSAWVNKDGSMNVYLDVLPLDGKLHIREPIESSILDTNPMEEQGPEKG